MPAPQWPRQLVAWQRRVRGGEEKREVRRGWVVRVLVFLREGEGLVEGGEDGSCCSGIVGLGVSDSEASLLGVSFLVFFRLEISFLVISLFEISGFIGFVTESLLDFSC